MHKTRDRTPEPTELIPAASDVLSFGSQSLFWQPRLVTGEPGLRHLPFLFWLYDACQPKKLVSIGLGQGQGFLAQCLAAERLRLGSVCLGIPTQGEDATALRDQVDRDYPTVGRVFAQDINALSITDQPIGDEIDILMLGPVMDESLDLILAANWFDRLSKSGVVIVQSPKGAGVCAAAQQKLDQLCAETPHILLDEDETDGLMVILVGEQRNGKLQRLASIAPSTAPFLEVRQVFRRLGMGLQRGFEAESLQVALNAAEAGLSAPQDRTGRGFAPPSAAPVAALEGAQDGSGAAERIQALEAELKTRLEDIALLTDAYAAEKQELNAKLKDAQSKRAGHWKRYEAELAQKQALEERFKRLEQSHADAVANLAAKDAELTSLRSQLRKLKTKLLGATAQAAAHKERGDALEETLAAFQASRSWKITAPLRALRGTPPKS